MKNPVVPRWLEPNLSALITSYEESISVISLQLCLSTDAVVVFNLGDGCQAPGILTKKLSHLVPRTSEALLGFALFLVRKVYKVVFLPSPKPPKSNDLQ